MNHIRTGDGSWVIGFNGFFWVFSIIRMRNLCHCFLV